LLAVAILAMTAAPARAQGLSVPPADFAARADEYLQAQMKVNRFSGVVLVAHEGKTIFEKGYGFANAEWEIPNTPQTKFRLGSITKQFTATTILLLAEEGKLRIEDPICNYLDPCPEAWKPVTIHHLLTHTSGIPSYTNRPEYRRTMMMPKTPAEMVAGFRDLPLEFAPGEKFAYNNSGYFLLGVIIEKVAGKPYETVLREKLFDPLGLQDTGYDLPQRVLKNRASGYSLNRGALVNAAYLDMGQPYAAGALYSTVHDLLRWDQLLHSGKVLKPESYTAMTTPVKENYAFGLIVRANSPETFDRRQIGHGGGINGFSTALTRFDDDRVTVVVLANNEATPAGRISRDLSAMYFGQKYEIPRERVAIKVDPKILQEYTGKYELRPDFVLTVTREGGQLMSQATGQPKAEIYPESETKFFLRVVDAQITFVKDAAGKVIHLILHQGGRDTPAKKIE
jgi:CubicO group peptidase (beta-lactamase class C family)